MLLQGQNALMAACTKNREPMYGNEKLYNKEITILDALPMVRTCPPAHLLIGKAVS